MPTRTGAVYVLRHGETEWSATGKHTGRTDVPLTRRGERQAVAAGSVINELRGAAAPPVLVLCSPRQRAVRTARLAGFEVDATDDELAEWDYGDYEGLTTPQIRERHPGWTVWTQPSQGGETAAHVGARADRVLARVRSALSAGDVVLAGHGHFSRVLIARWLGLPPSAGAHFGLNPASTAVLDHEWDEPRIGRLNVPPGGEH
jgi:broad specificity phosphatase PhoE